MVLRFPNFSSTREALPVCQYASELWICVTMTTSSHCAPNQAPRCECSTIKTSKIYNQDPQALQSRPPSSTIKPSNKQPLCNSNASSPTGYSNSSTNQTTSSSTTSSSSPTTTLKTNTTRYIRDYHCDIYQTLSNPNPNPNPNPNNIIVNYLIVKPYNNSQNKHYALYTRLPL